MTDVYRSCDTCGRREMMRATQLYCSNACRMRAKRARAKQADTTREARRG